MTTEERLVQEKRLAEAEARYFERRCAMLERQREVEEARMRLWDAQEDHALALSELDALQRRQVRQEVSP